MKRHCYVICILLFLTSLMPGPAMGRDMRVVFFNPGSVDDIGVWGFVDKFMQAAADRLGIRLEILHANRDHLKMLDQAREVSHRADPPDYAVLVNEKQAGLAMMEFFRGTSVKIMLMHNDLTAEQRLQAGGERERMANWIGTLTSNERRASLSLIQALARSCKGFADVAAVSGIASNPVTLAREEGLKDYLLDPQLGRLLQIVHADWSREDARARTTGLLERYPGLNVIWAANDSMALGALDAVKAAGRAGEVAVGGQGGFPDALDSVVTGGLKATVGGQTMTGGWVMVLLYDYAHGRDFADDAGLNVIPDHLAVIDSPAKAALFRKIVIDHPETIDFRLFSKVLNPKLERYDFRYARLVKASGEAQPE